MPTIMISSNSPAPPTPTTALPLDADAGGGGASPRDWRRPHARTSGRAISKSPVPGKSQGGVKIWPAFLTAGRYSLPYRAYRMPRLLGLMAPWYLACPIALQPFSQVTLDPSV